ncbi:31685_t:CDS:2, partial [Gigaspora margarita]
MTNSDDADVLESTFSFEERDLILTDDEANNDQASNKTDNEPEEEEFGEESGEESDHESEALTDEVHQHDVLICKQKTPSTLASTKKAYTISPLAQLEHPLLFGDHAIRRNNGDSDRHTRRELWIVEGDSTYVDPESISQRIIVWFCDSPEHERYNYYVKKKILYRFDNRWKYRDIFKRTNCLVNTSIS